MENFGSKFLKPRFPWRFFSSCYLDAFAWKGGVEMLYVNKGTNKPQLLLIPDVGLDYGRYPQSADPTGCL